MTAARAATAVSYQAILPASGPASTTAAFRPLDDTAVRTRRRDADRDVRVRLSKRQERWLREAADAAAGGVDVGDVVRALVDLGPELGVDFTRVTSRQDLRRAVREAVLVRGDGDRAG